MGTTQLVRSVLALAGWLGWLDTKRLWVRFPGRAYTQATGRIASQGAYGGNQLMFLSLHLSLKSVAVPLGESKT